MKQSIHAETMHQAFKASAAQHYRRETEQRLEENAGEDERNAAREWLRHVEAGRIRGSSHS